jgi:transcriptional regulator with XRE-family HTH domain
MQEAEMSVNERIKQVRHALKLNQIDFSKGIYLSNGYYAGIELGNHPVNNRIIELIVVKYGVNRHWLETGEGIMFDNEPDLKMMRMIELFGGLSGHFQDFLLDFVAKLIKLQSDR